ncbi:dihydrolipoyl dehydrogenase [Luteibacter yeojuensis]|uniref:Dihydrolipoyl dehydrogenase n=1 Tax=Luteibacter yeojuensis TaxID=345309 RepID=A0A0F3KJ04_9GAMM|nr:dihydrolipoyl dehydrogenase [Luteibacter yeojuensis]KJV30074.1 dihydrolipoamide dehydrogenase [Luteibacter yeojuensis]
MANTIELKVPDLGGSHDVPVIEILVKAGDTVEKDQSLITLESDKATMDVPASQGGKVVDIKVKVGDEVNEGTVILTIEAAEGGADAKPAAADKAAAPKASADKAVGQGTVSEAPAHPAPSPAPAPPKQEAPSAAAPQAAAASGRKADIECQLVVLGSGPGGYTAAFRGADVGLDTVLVERYASLGGVCLNVGCIPSKALLHASAVIDEASSMAEHGISFGSPKIDIDKLRSFKEKVVGKLTGGLAQMAKARKVRTVIGTGTFISPNELEVATAEGNKLIRFENAIIAAGSQSVKLPSFPWDDERIIDSTGALELKDVPKKMLVVGGGIIGLEMATVYASLGSEVTVVELADQLIPGADADLIKPLQQRIAKRYKGIHLKTKVVEAKATKKGIEVTFDGESIPDTKVYDRVLVSVGRAPNGGKVGADKAGVQVTDRGFIPVDRQMRTNVPHIFAIGDLVGQPMLAHKATHEAKVAAEVAAGQKSFFDARVIPSVAYTDPEIAWVGVTEREAKEKGLKVGVGKFPWAASGRAIGIDRTEGFTKLIFDEETHRIVGAGIVGVHAGDLISELALAIEMGCEAGDIGRTVHPHPTLGESVGMAAEVYEGTITDLYIPKKK